MNTPWIPYTSETLPKEEGYYLTCRRIPDRPDQFVLQGFRDGSFSFSGVVAYMEIPPVPQEFKLLEGLQN
jgi:hypothetical protein